MFHWSVVVSDSEKTHLIVQDCIISQFGVVQAGFEISESDVDPITWNYLNRNQMVRTLASIISEADSDDVAKESEKVDTTLTPEQVIEKVKSILGDGKLQLKTIVRESGISEDVFSPLLTEANGFKKSQGWFSKAVVQQTESETSSVSENASAAE